MDELDSFFQGPKRGVRSVHRVCVDYRERDYVANANAIQVEVPIASAMEELKTIGARVAWARKQRKLTQQQLATNAGVAQSTIGSLESGQREKPRELNSIAKALRASVAWIERGEGEWEESQVTYSSNLEAAVASFLADEGVMVRHLNRSDAGRLPTWLTAHLGNGSTYVPDFELHVPNRSEPIFLEVKPKTMGGHIVSGRLIELAQQHPGKFVFFETDLHKPRLGVDDLMDQLYPGEFPRPDPAHASSTRRSPLAPRTAETPAAYGMEPILAWEHVDDLPEGEFVMVPRLDVHLSAGAGHDQVEIDLVKENPQAFRAEWIRLMRLKPSKLAAMRASGESMEPTIHDGDSLLIDTSQIEVVDGKVYALWYEGGERVKRLFRLPGGSLRIESDNPRFRALEVRPPELEHVRIIGRVVHRSGTGGL